MTENINSREWEALSAYLDGQLRPVEQARLETRLASSATLRTGLEELRRTRDVIRSQPPIRAPRNFTLTPAMAGIRERPRRFGWPSAFGLTSALASIMLVLVIVGEFLSAPGVMPVALAPSTNSETFAAESASVETPVAEMLQADQAEPSVRMAPDAQSGETLTEEALAQEQPQEEMPAADLATPEGEAPFGAAALPYPEAPVEESPQEEPKAMMVPQTSATGESQATEMAYLPEIEKGVTADTQDGVAVQEPPASWWNAWRIAQVLFGSVALVTGLSATYLRRRKRV